MKNNEKEFESNESFLELLIWYGAAILSLGLIYVTHIVLKFAFKEALKETKMIER